MHRLAAPVALIAGLLLGGAPARAQAEFLLGDWQQIASNAGRCSTCQITLSRRGGDLIVTANNGWSAVVGERRSGDGVVLSGSGRWSKHSVRLDGKTFTVDLVPRADRLYMTMRIDTGRSAWTVKAVYGRLWLGS